MMEVNVMTKNKTIEVLESIKEQFVDCVGIKTRISRPKQKG